MDPMSDFDIRFVFTLPPSDSTLQYKKVYTSEITFLALHPCPTPFLIGILNLVNVIRIRNEINCLI